MPSSSNCTRTLLVPYAAHDAGATRDMTTLRKCVHRDSTIAERNKSTLDKKRFAAARLFKAQLGALL